MDFFSQSGLLRDVKYKPIDGLRCYAALLVFFVHIAATMLSLVENQRAAHDVFTVQLFSFLKDGHHGVDVFFIISGFLMGRIITRNSFSYLAFVRARIMRVYPAFFLSLVVCAYYYSWQYGLNVNTRDFIGNMLFLNAFNEFNVIPYNSVSWSLGYEFVFYLVIPSALLFSSVPQRFKAATALGLVIAFVPISFIRMTGMFAGYFIASLSDETLKQVGRLPVWPPLLAYSAIVLLKRANLISYMEFYYSFLVLGGLLFVQIVFGENRLSRLFQSPILRILGTISYSFYLLHYACIIVAFEHIMPRGLPVGLSFLVLTISSLSLAIACASLSWYMFERPYFGNKGTNASSMLRAKDVPNAGAAGDLHANALGVAMQQAAPGRPGRRKTPLVRAIRTSLRLAKALLMNAIGAVRRRAGQPQAACKPALKGWVERVGNFGEHYVFSGWALYPADPDPLKIEILAEGNLIGWGTTQIQRVDVKKTHGAEINTVGFDIPVSRSLIPVGVEVEVVATTDAGRRKSLPINPGDNALKRRADLIRPGGTLVPADASE